MHSLKQSLLILRSGIRLHDLFLFSKCGYHNISQVSMITYIPTSDFYRVSMLTLYLHQICTRFKEEHIYYKPKSNLYKVSRTSISKTRSLSCEALHPHETQLCPYDCAFTQQCKLIRPDDIAPNECSHIISKKNEFPPWQNQKIQFQHNQNPFQLAPQVASHLKHRCYVDVNEECSFLFGIGKRICERSCLSTIIH